MLELGHGRIHMHAVVPCYHLSGDRYFKVSNHGTNLQRAIEQFGLFAQFQSNQEIMRAGAEKLLG